MYSSGNRGTNKTAFLRSTSSTPKQSLSRQPNIQWKYDSCLNKGSLSVPYLCVCFPDSTKTRLRSFLVFFFSALIFSSIACANRNRFSRWSSKSTRKVSRPIWNDDDDDVVIAFVLLRRRRRRLATSTTRRGVVEEDVARSIQLFLLRKRGSFIHKTLSM